jgi:hypothetical protein
MIKIKINEARYTGALTRQAQSIPVTRSKTTKTPNVSPTSGIESTQPSTPQQPEQQQAQEPTEIPAGWKPQIGTEIELKGVKYKANAIGGWLPNGIGLPIPKTSPIFSTLNILAYNEEQKKKGQPTSTTAPLEPEDQETEEVQRQPQQSSQINFKELWHQVHEKQGNADEFVKAVSNFLLNDKPYSESYNQQLKQLENAIKEKFKEIQSKKKWKDRIDTATRIASSMFSEQKQINEVIDPVTGLAILIGSISVGGLYGIYKSNKEVQEAWKTPEGQYLHLLGLYVKIAHLIQYLTSPNKNLIQEIIDQEVKDRLNNYNKFNINPFNKTNLLNKLKEDVKRELQYLINTITNLEREQQTNPINESTIKRWKLLANIK